MSTSGTTTSGTMDDGVESCGVVGTGHGMKGEV